MKASPYLLLTLSSLFWAGNWIVGRGIRADVSPFALAFWRWVIAFLLFLPLAWPHLRASLPVIRSQWHWLTFFAISGTALYNALGYLGLQYTSATNGLLLHSFIPIVIVALAWLFQNRRLRRIEAIGIATSFGGVLSIVASGDPAMLLQLQINPGDIWILVSVFVWSAYTLLLPRRPALNPFVFLALIAGIGIVACLPVYLWEVAQGRGVSQTPAAYLAITYAGVFPAFLGYICWNRGVELIGAARAGIFIHLMPVFGLLLAALVLGEQLAFYHVVGIVLIFGGILLTTRR